MPFKQWVKGSNPFGITSQIKDFVAQLERATAYEAVGYWFESSRGHKFLERKLAYWGYWLTFPTVSREKRVRSSYKPQMVFLVYLVKSRNVNPKNRVRFPKTPKLYNWEDNDWLFTCIGGRRLQVRVLFLRLKAGMAEWHTRLI